MLAWAWKSDLGRLGRGALTSGAPAMWSVEAAMSSHRWPQRGAVVPVPQQVCTEFRSPDCMGGFCHTGRVP